MSFYLCAPLLSLFLFRFLLFYSYRSLPLVSLSCCLLALSLSFGTPWKIFTLIRNSGFDNVKLIYWVTSCASFERYTHRRIICLHFVERNFFSLFFSVKFQGYLWFTHITFTFSMNFPTILTFGICAIRSTFHFDNLIFFPFLFWHYDVFFHILRSWEIFTLFVGICDHWFRFIGWLCIHTDWMEVKQ